MGKSAKVSVFLNLPPTTEAASKMSTLMPASFSVLAAKSPEAPAPTTTTLPVNFGLNGLVFLQLSKNDGAIAVTDPARMVL